MSHNINVSTSLLGIQHVKSISVCLTMDLSRYRSIARTIYDLPVPRVRSFRSCVEAGLVSSLLVIIQTHADVFLSQVSSAEKLLFFHVYEKQGRSIVPRFCADTDGIHVLHVHAR